MTLDIPETLDYNIPGRVYSVNFSEFDDLSHLDEPVVFKYNAYVIWCMIQCYWYYCIQQPQVSDELYDAVVQFLRDCEDHCPGDFDERWSPVGRQGNPGQWKSGYTHYPQFIQDMFISVPHSFRMQYPLTQNQVKTVVKTGTASLEKKRRIPAIFH